MSIMSKEQAALLAKFIHEAVRPEWDVAGIVHALGEARTRGPASVVAIAAIVAADTPANRTPAVIPLSGPHWPVSGTTRRQPPPPARTCGICYLGHDECRRRWHWDHEFESLAEVREKRIAQADTIPRIRRAQYLDGRPINEVELP